jgi:hypothetical protein
VRSCKKMDVWQWEAFEEDNIEGTGGEGDGCEVEGCWCWIVIAGG